MTEMSASTQDRLRRATGCELRFDDLTRQLYATDASLYQIEPAGVAFPRTAAEAGEVIRAAADEGMSVMPRGAGTGLAGGALGDGLVVDFARYNREIRDFNAESWTVRVGAGVVLDQLNAFLRPHGLWFGPDVATSSRATLGGMIANNSSGAHVPRYGTTADHVRSVEVVLVDGTVATAGGEGDGLAAQRAAVDALVDRYAAAIAERLPAGLMKRWPGYGFDRYLGSMHRRHNGGTPGSIAPSPSLPLSPSASEASGAEGARGRGGEGETTYGDLSRVIAGSEGTLAGIFSAELALVPLPARRGLGVIFFESVAEAMAATVELLDLEAAAIEHIDRLLFDQTRGQRAFRAARSLLRLDEEPCESILIVEFFEETAGAEVGGYTGETPVPHRTGWKPVPHPLPDGRGSVREKLAALAKRAIGVRKLICTDEEEQALVWQVRKQGLNLLTACKGAAKPTPGIEDVCVRPERLPEYVRGVQGLFRRVGVEGSFYGHAASGLLHVRPKLDLHTREDIEKYRVIADEVSALTRQFKGSIAAEHGVGIARTEFLAEHLGPELMAASAELKRVFDPKGVLNPGKIVPDGRYRIDTRLRLGAGREIRLPFTPRLGFVERDGSFVGNLEQCNGNGHCLKHAVTMCPTYIATGEEFMTTRGRANAIRAALEGRIAGDGDPLASAELDAALSNCLSCKACKTECPSNVDLALLKAELNHAAHRRRGKVPLLDRMIAGADRLGRWGCATAAVSNAMLRSRVVRGLMSRTLGLARERTMPPYARERFDRWFRRRGSVAPASRQWCGTGVSPVQEHEPASRGRVILWDDTWVRYHEPGIGRAATAVLEACGFDVVLAEGRACCGRPAFSRGVLDEADRLGRHNVVMLDTHRRDAGATPTHRRDAGATPDRLATGATSERLGGEAPIVFLEPSCYAMFVDEYLQLGIPGAAAVAERCVLFEGFMEELLSREPDALRLKAGVKHVAIHAHCHAKALTDVSVGAALARRIPGATVELLDTGCCGMAGAFGMLQRKYELSLQIAEPMVKLIRGLPAGAVVVASGTSCRHQIADLTEARPVHMAELLAAGL